MSPNAELTPRELQVLRLVLRGLGNKEIARDLGVTEQGVKERVSGLLAKFAVPNRAALAEAGVRLELTVSRGIVILSTPWTSVSPVRTLGRPRDRSDGSA